MRERFISPFVALPLTLTLSPGEREQRGVVGFYLEDGPVNSVVGLSAKQRIIHPLPKGEGRGEGEASNRITLTNATT